MFPHGANGRVWERQGAQPVCLGGLEVTQMLLRVFQGGICCCPLSSASLLQELLLLLGTDEKHLHYKLHEVHKKTGTETGGPGSGSLAAAGRQNHVLHQRRPPSAQAIIDSYL